MIEATSAAENPASVMIFRGVKSPMGNGISDPIMMRWAPTHLPRSADARVVNDGVVIHGRQSRIGIGELVAIEFIIPSQSADHVRQRRAANANNDLGVGVAHDVAGIDQPADSRSACR